MLDFNAQSSANTLRAMAKTSRVPPEVFDSLFSSTSARAWAWSPSRPCLVRATGFMLKGGSSNALGVVLTQQEARSVDRT